MQIVGLVSDRARALVKLGKESYLNVCSMPDLFHFMQDLGHLAGLQIGRKYKKAVTEREKILRRDKEITASEEEIISNTEKVIAVYEDYRSSTREVNQTIHPFNKLDEWSEKGEIYKNLVKSICKISDLGEQINVSVNIKKAAKLLRQIPDIVKGVDEWVSRNKNKIKEWVVDKVISEVESVWLERFLLPSIYWELQLGRTKNGRKNPKLVAYYENRMVQSQDASIQHLQDLNISASRQTFIFEMAYQMAKSFQRSSSQVEGRNGYLAFVHHGQKGIPVNKMKALTVIHNFDTKRSDGYTPAKRLFRKDFPNLFEFLCSNVTGFKEPRKRKIKTLNLNYLQR